MEMLKRPLHQDLKANREELARYEVDNRAARRRQAALDRKEAKRARNAEKREYADQP